MAFTKFCIHLLVINFTLFHAKSRFVYTEVTGRVRIPLNIFTHLGHHEFYYGILHILHVFRMLALSYHFSGIFSLRTCGNTQKPFLSGPGDETVRP